MKLESIVTGEANELDVNRDYLQDKVHACVGGTSVLDDQRILMSGVHVVVGTPGCVFDMLHRD